MPMVASRTEVLRDTLAESFTQDLSDGYWYPMQPGVPLVRVQFGTGGYCVERRRNADSSWMPVVTADCADFDPAAFRIWAAQWPLVA